MLVFIEFILFPKEFKMLLYDIIFFEDSLFILLNKESKLIIYSLKLIDIKYK